MSGLRSRAFARGPIRYGAWRGDAAVALLAPIGGRPIGRSAIRACLEQLEHDGFTSVLTSALAPSDQEPFLELGFAVRDRLHLLAHDLRVLPEVGRRGLRRARRSDRRHVLAVDAAAFPPFWRLDDTGLDDALDATPVARFRVAAGPHGGYAITGRAGPRGYLQRLAVHPAAQGRGTGSALIVDGLRWARRWGAREVMVNTQTGNDGAVRLYERLGFVHRPEGLVVLDRALGGPG
jgi:GNAT superfamily N-acetyltransferase